MFCLNVDLACEVMGTGSQIILILFLFDLFSFDDWDTLWNTIDTIMPLKASGFTVLPTLVWDRKNMKNKLAPK